MLVFVFLSSFFFYPIKAKSTIFTVTATTWWLKGPVLRLTRNSKLPFKLVEHLSFLNIYIFLFLPFGRKHFDDFFFVCSERSLREQRRCMLEIRDATARLARYGRKYHVDPPQENPHREIFPNGLFSSYSLIRPFQHLIKLVLFLIVCREIIRAKNPVACSLSLPIYLSC